MEPVTSTSEDTRVKPDLCIEISVRLASSHELLKRLEGCVRTLELRSYHSQRSDEYKDLVTSAKSVLTDQRLRISKLADDNIYNFFVNFQGQNDQ